MMWNLSETLFVTLFWNLALVLVLLTATALCQYRQIEKLDERIKKLNARKEE